MLVSERLSTFTPSRLMKEAPTTFVVMISFSPSMTWSWIVWIHERDSSTVGGYKAAVAQYHNIFTGEPLTPRASTATQRAARTIKGHVRPSNDRMWNVA